jgi:hypothetical protein
MAVVNCPSCQEGMEIEEHEPNTEWECPGCASVFRAHGREDGSVRLEAVSNNSTPASAITAASAQELNTSRRRRKKRKIEEPDRGDPDGRNDRSAAISLQHRFPDMLPGNPPPLRTYNGTGIAMYGARDFDPRTGTYVATTCFVIFFVPIIFLGAYRVADAPVKGWFSSQGWHVLGRVPLSPFARRWNYVIPTALVALFIFWMAR